MTFTVGETVVYPNHGAAVIEDIETRQIKGEDKQYLVLRIVAQQDLVVRVPACNLARARLVASTMTNVPMRALRFSSALMNCGAGICFAITSGSAPR